VGLTVKQGTSKILFNWVVRDIMIAAKYHHGLSTGYMANFSMGKRV
jgi:hypothetical protein